MYIYDISETPRLEKILTGSSRTINAIAWNPHDPNSIAMTVSEDENNVLIWDLAAEALAKRLSALGPAAKHVAWCAHSSATHTHAQPHAPTQYTFACSQERAPRGRARDGVAVWRAHALNRPQWRP